jgi:hypothetical protein
LGDVLNHLDSTNVRESGILVAVHPTEFLEDLVVWPLPVSHAVGLTGAQRITIDHEGHN